MSLYFCNLKIYFVKAYLLRKPHFFEDFDAFIFTL